MCCKNLSCNWEQELITRELSNSPEVTVWKICVAFVNVDFETREITFHSKHVLRKGVLKLQVISAWKPLRLVVLRQNYYKII